MVYLVVVLGLLFEKKSKKNFSNFFFLSFQKMASKRKPLEGKTIAFSFF